MLLRPIIYTNVICFAVMVLRSRGTCYTNLSTLAITLIGWSLTLKQWFGSTQCLETLVCLYPEQIKNSVQ